MITVEELSKIDLKQFVKILVEVEYSYLVRDQIILRDILESYYNSLGDYRGIFVAKVNGRVGGLVQLNIKDLKRKRIPILEFIKLFGFINGLKLRLLINFFNKTPKKDEVYIRYFCVHPNLDVIAIGDKLINKVIDYAIKMNKKKISIWVPVDSDIVDICINNGFAIKRMIKSSFTEKYFGNKYYYYLELPLKRA